MATGNASRFRKEIRTKRTTKGQVLRGTPLFEKRLLMLVYGRQTNGTKVRAGVHMVAASAIVRAQKPQHVATRQAVVKQGDRVCDKVDSLHADVTNVLTLLRPSEKGCVKAAQNAVDKQHRLASAACNMALKAKDTLRAASDKQRPAKQVLLRKKSEEATNAVRLFRRLFSDELFAPLQAILDTKIEELESGGSSASNAPPSAAVSSS